MIPKELITEVAKLDIDDLKELSDRVWEIRKNKRAVDSLVKRSEFKVGDKVTIPGEVKFLGIEGVIKEFKRTNAVVEFNGRRWRVPVGLLEKVGG